uniref:Desaturase 12 n=1 Tax=Streltzoviella insularis TaxID=1206366 RepID=A0A7D5YV48_9NEOP|nr:desaturase 12 [Streltzoviella insularis]
MIKNRSKRTGDGSDLWGRVSGENKSNDVEDEPAKND